MHTPIAALFTTAKTQKQPKCPLTDEWKKKMQCVCVSVCVCVCVYVKHNGISLNHDRIMPFTATWMDQETFKLSELRQTEGECMNVYG